MKRIALTGGIACGKSLVAKYLNELGVETIDADDVVHELIPDPCERRRLAAEVFADPEKRRALEARLHPLVKAKILAWQDLRRETEDGSREDVRRETEDARREDLRRETEDAKSHVLSLTSLRVAVIPLLFEARWDGEYDIICCVRSARATQVARMTANRGYTREEAEARLKAQMPVEEKAEKSHYVIDNDGSAEELRAKVAAFVGWLRARVGSTAIDSNRGPSNR